MRKRHKNTEIVLRLLRLFAAKEISDIADYAIRKNSALIPGVIGEEFVGWETVLCEECQELLTVSERSLSAEQNSDRVMHVVNVKGSLAAALRVHDVHGAYTHARGNALGLIIDVQQHNLSRELTVRERPTLRLLRKSPQGHFGHRHGARRAFTMSAPDYTLHQKGDKKEQHLFHNVTSDLLASSSLAGICIGYSLLDLGIV